MSFSAPIDAWSRVIPSPSWRARAGPAPAIAAIATVAIPSSTDGNGCVRRTRPAARSRVVKPACGRSDVDQLVEVLDEVVDQPVAPVRHLAPDAGHERVQRD